jgi:23S rRNA pseudouridine1911/1915/1917 synthase
MHIIKAIEYLENIGNRLDLFVALALPAYTRSQIKRVIESNQVFVNEVINYKAGYKVQKNDVIKFPKLENLFEKKNIIESVFDLKILFEDEDYLFIDKPSGISVHPVNLSQRDTIVNKLINKYKNLPSNNILRPGIVHRLDKDTSGVMVVAKTSKSLWWLSKQFADRKVEKQYTSIGVCEFIPTKLHENAEFKVEGYMFRTGNKRNFYQISTQEIKKSRFSSSEFRLLYANKVGGLFFVLFQVLPKTGRTHQIRVHQKSIQYPIAGDAIYLPKKILDKSIKIFEDKKISPRLMLHASSIQFENYDGEKYYVNSNLPTEFDELMKAK